MPETLLDRSPVWLLYVGTVLLLLAGNEIGFRLGRWRRAHMPADEKTPASAIMGSTLGLLAFMLAFTFGMSGTRFDARKQLVLDEASAVLRAYQRAQLLAEPQRGECSRLLQDYVQLRIEVAAAKSLSEAQALVTRSEGIQDALWKEAQTLVERPGPGFTGFSQSLSELTDLQMRRVRAAVWNRIPPAILTTLYGIAFLALSAMGYGAGLAESRTVVPSLLLILTFSAIIVLIVEMERPRQQLFQVSQEPMADVARRIQALRQ
ncbi:MAG TPA: hypothetical protein VI589_13335 [Vicinamibacteria bacterium]